MSIMQDSKFFKILSWIEEKLKTILIHKSLIAL